MVGTQFKQRNKLVKNLKLLQFPKKLPKDVLKFKKDYIGL